MPRQATAKRPECTGPDDAGQPVRRIVPAGNAAPPETTGASSVCAAGRAAGAKPRIVRAHLPLLDIDKLTVTSNVPLPEPRSARGTTKYDAMFDKLAKDGDALLHLPAIYKAALVKAAQVYVQRRPQMAKSALVIRGMPNNGSDIGIWRVAKPAGVGTNTKAAKP